MFDKMKDLFDLQAKISVLKKELTNAFVDLEWFGGKVKIRINAQQEIQKLEIDNAFVSSSPDLSLKLLSCFNEAVRKSQVLGS